ncbi:hypothetical protein DSAG12_00792 [Promethearchaeum syntrophicum]|uniref:Uncharacterized protein n=1 Tax=Promethearchaeum syntrophicum TaxID=2594042 RepID=A0A5B9D749_9ARCH|nr:hypothetical protein [Candidatus Prometheoarchaeum syntrophicum]QEE14969.1 hypothetical protein DSAG12_00792 [Candidatus Prometheoarchaeum syntrophicum]
MKSTKKITKFHKKPRAIVKEKLQIIYNYFFNQIEESDSEFSISAYNLSLIQHFDNIMLYARMHSAEDLGKKISDLL